MSIKVGEQLWECSICHKQYDRILYAQHCENLHSITYIPFTVNEIDNLVQFIFTGEKKLLTEEFMKKLMSYTKKGK